LRDPNEVRVGPRIPLLMVAWLTHY
jgi:hypothetical protein